MPTKRDPLMEAFQKMEQSVQTEMQKLGDKIQKMDSNLKRIDCTAKKALKKAKANEEEIQSLKDSVAYYADLNRRKNLRLSGIAMEIQHDQLEAALAEWITQQGVEITVDDIERAHRTGRAGFTTGPPRDVIVVFAREKLRDRVFKTLRSKEQLEMGGRKILVRQDLSMETIKKKRILQPYAQKIFQSGQRFTWLFNPISILVFKDGRRLMARNPAEAEQLLDRLGIDRSELPSREEEAGEGEEDEEEQDSGSDEEEQAGTSKKRPRQQS